jgi:hypothetical protein
MNKSDFILFLIKMSSENINCWRKTYENSDDYWHLYKPFVDWLEDDMDLTKDGVVKITYNKSLYDNESAKIFETTYDDFVKNYNKTIR